MAPAFRPTKDDLSLLEYVHTLRMAHINHLAALAQRSYAKTAGRVAILEEHDYLASHAPAAEHIYVLGSCRRMQGLW